MNVARDDETNFMMYKARHDGNLTSHTDSIRCHPSVDEGGRRDDEKQHQRRAKKGEMFQSHNEKGKALKIHAKKNVTMSP